MKRTFRIAVCTLPALMLAACLFTESVSASASKGRCYTISSGKTTVYGNSSLTRKCGTVSGSDKLTILSISRKSCKISYKTSDKKKKTGYVSTGAILRGTSGESFKVSQKLKACRRPGGKTCGSVSRGTKVTILGTSGKYTQIRYNTSGSTWFAFVKTEQLNKAR